VTAPVLTPVLTLQGITKQFGSYRAVDRLDLEIPAGSIYGFLGQNGAGKTTTIRVILSILEPTEGSVTILGRPSALEVRERIGYLPEEKGLYKKMRAWAIVAYFGTLKGMTRADAKRKALELLERYGLKEFAHHKCDALSKGMQQKVQLLASIVHDPEFVILDEPFSGLDPINQDVMEGVIRELCGRGRTVIFSTHVMEHADRLCDRILLMAKGRKIFDGTVADAKKSIPRRVRIETESDPSPLLAVNGVLRIDRLEPPGRYEFVLSDRADPDEILRACFRSQIQLRSFDRRDPTLRDVFVSLVGSDGGVATAEPQ
jgi:ABC-2 type transport system ATP-binding protein